MKIFSLRHDPVQGVSWQYQWYGVFSESITKSGHELSDNPKEFKNLEHEFDCIFVHTITLKALQDEEIFYRRMGRGERVYLFHHDNSPLTQKPNLGANNAQILFNFNERLRAKCTGIIALNSHSYEIKLKDLEEGRKHLMHLPPVCREFNDNEGRGILIYGNLRNKTETVYAILIAIASALSNRKLEIGSLNPAGKLQYAFHKLLSLTSKLHNIRTHVGSFNLVGEDEISAWDNCAVVVILRKKGHCNSGVLTKALAEGKLVLTTEIDAVKRDFQSPDIRVARNILHLFLELFMLNRNLMKRRVHWRYAAASKDNFNDTFEKYRVELDNVICQRPYVRVLRD